MKILSTVILFIAISAQAIAADKLPDCDTPKPAESARSEWCNPRKVVPPGTCTFPWEVWVKEQADAMARKQQMRILSEYTAAKVNLDVEMTRLYIKWLTDGPDKKILQSINNAASVANKAWWKCLAAKMPREECDTLFKLSSDLDDLWLMIKEQE